MALPLPTKSLLETSPDAAMLFAPFGCTHPCTSPYPALSAEAELTYLQRTLLEVTS